MFTRNECGRPHRFEFIIRDIDGARIAQLGGVAEPTWDDAIPVGWRLGVFVALNFGLPLPHYGEYAVEIPSGCRGCATVPPSSTAARAVAPSAWLRRRGGPRRVEGFGPVGVGSVSPTGQGARGRVWTLARAS